MNEAASSSRVVFALLCAKTNYFAARRHSIEMLYDVRTRAVHSAQHGHRWSSRGKIKYEKCEKQFPHIFSLSSNIINSSEQQLQKLPHRDEKVLSFLFLRARCRHRSFTWIMKQVRFFPHSHTLSARFSVLKSGHYYFRQPSQYAVSLFRFSRRETSS